MIAVVAFSAGFVGIVGAGSFSLLVHFPWSGINAFSSPAVSHKYEFLYECESGIGMEFPVM